MSIGDPVGKCAVVTGGGGLLGRSMSLAFARAGMNVLVADIRAQAAADVASQINALGRCAVAVTTDVSELVSVNELADRAFGTFGQVNLLCNNAGSVTFGMPWELTLGDWDSVVRSHLGGVINGLTAFLPRMLAGGGGRHILNTSSMAGVGLGELRPTTLPYVTAKFAITGLTEALAPALSAEGIGVSVLNPGLVTDDPDPHFLTPSGLFYKDEVLRSAPIGDVVLAAIQRDQLHIFTHRTSLREIQGRHEMLLRSYRASHPSAEVPF